MSKTTTILLSLIGGAGLGFFIAMQFGGKDLICDNQELKSKNDAQSSISLDLKSRLEKHETTITQLNKLYFIMKTTNIHTLQ